MEPSQGDNKERAVGQDSYKWTPFHQVSLTSGQDSELPFLVRKVGVVLPALHISCLRRNSSCESSLFKLPLGGEWPDSHFTSMDMEAQ